MPEKWSQTSARRATRPSCTSARVQAVMNPAVSPRHRHRRHARPGARELGRVGQRSGLRLPRSRTCRSAASRPGATPTGASASRSATRCWRSGAPGSWRATTCARCCRWTHPSRAALRASINRALRADFYRPVSAAATALLPQSAVTMGLPCEIGDYTDFYIGIHHATAVGKLFRPTTRSLPNYKRVPIGYHGRASSINASPSRFRRPRGQQRGADDASPPVWAASRRVDHELEPASSSAQGMRRGAHPDRARRGAPVRRRPVQRLERARPAGLGVPAAGALPGEELPRARLRRGW